MSSCTVAMVPQILNSLLLAHDHMNLRTFGYDPGKCLQRSVGNCFQQRGVPDQGDTLKLAIGVTTGVEGSAIERTDQTVVSYQAHHGNVMQWASAQELQHLELLFRR